MATAEENAKHIKQLLKEYQFFRENYYELLMYTRSNKKAIKHCFQQMEIFVRKGINKKEPQINLDNYIGKLNTIIGIALLNDVEDHEIEFRYVTRIPSVLFNVYLNKLKIIQVLKVNGKNCYLTHLPPEIALMQQLKTIELNNCQFNELPSTIQSLKHLSIRVNGGRLKKYISNH